MENLKNTPTNSLIAELSQRKDVAVWHVTVEDIQQEAAEREYIISTYVAEDIVERLKDVGIVHNQIEDMIYDDGVSINDVAYIEAQIEFRSEPGILESVKIGIAGEQETDEREDDDEIFFYIEDADELYKLCEVDSGESLEWFIRRIDDVVSQDDLV